MVESMTNVVFHQSYMTQPHFLLKLIHYYVIVLSFILIFIDNWFPYCTMALCIVSAFYLSHMKQ